MKRGRAAARRNRNEWIKSALGILSILGMIATAVYFYRSGDAPLNKQSMCPTEGPSGHVVLLIDKTDPLTFIQKKAFLQFVEQMADERVNPGYLLSVFVIGENYKDAADPVFEMCNPGTGKDKSEMNHNRRLLLKQYNSKYREPMLRLAETLQAAKPANASPIFEMIQLASINGFHKANIQGPKRLIIISDMLHNTPPYKMYVADFDFNFERLKNSDYGSKLAIDLRGVEVEIRYLINTPRLQTKRHIYFWEQFFNNAGARLVAVIPMEG